MSASTTDLLKERSTTHGSFASNAKYGQALRLLFRNSPHWDRMSFVQAEALDMIACKLSRILSGQAGHKDHWADIAGYAQLVVTTPDSYDARQLAPKPAECEITAFGGSGNYYRPQFDVCGNKIEE